MGFKYAYSMRKSQLSTDFSTEVLFRHLQLYQVYAKASPEEVHAVLRKYDSSYIILEDSICLSRSDQRCNLPTTMDLTNGHVRKYFCARKLRFPMPFPVLPYFRMICWASFLVHVMEMRA